MGKSCDHERFIVLQMFPNPKYTSGRTQAYKHTLYI